MAGFGIQKRGTSKILVKRKEFSEGGYPLVEEVPEPKMKRMPSNDDKDYTPKKERASSNEDSEYFTKETRLGKNKFKVEKVKKSKDFFDNKEEGWHTYGGNRTKEDIEEAFKRRKYSPKFAKGGQAKVSKVMKEFGKGKLHSGKKGPVVKSRKQAIAIALSEAGMSKKKK
jgi:hypothetical protein